MINKLIPSCLIAFCLTAQFTNSFAQDLIFKRNGDEIQAYVEEVGLESIKYKTFTN
jgi:hypothetical protein